MEKIMKLIDLYPIPMQNGIFSDMYEDNDLKELFDRLFNFLAKGVNIHYYDVDYVINHSQSKSVSPLIDFLSKDYVIDGNFAYVISSGSRITAGDAKKEISKKVINEVIKCNYLFKWTSLLDLLMKDYNPLEPFKIKNETNRDIDKMISTNKSSTQNHITENNNSIYAFNSGDTPVDTDSSNTSLKYQDNTSYERNKSMHQIIERTGNIGNITTQELIRQQRDILEWNFIKVIYNDLDGVLVRSKYQI